MLLPHLHRQKVSGKCFFFSCPGSIGGPELLTVFAIWLGIPITSAFTIWTREQMTWLVWLCRCLPFTNLLPYDDFCVLHCLKYGLVLVVQIDMEIWPQEVGWNTAALGVFPVLACRPLLFRPLALCSDKKWWWCVRLGRRDKLWWLTKM